VLDADAETRFHFISRSRGFSKTTDLAGVALAVLLAQAPAGSKSYAVAADQEQARLLLDSVEGFVRRSPVLAGYVEVRQSRVVVKQTGATLVALAADAASSWGLRPFLCVVDELAQWGETGGPRRIWEALTSAVPKVNGRLVVITTAGSPGHFSKRIRDHAAIDPLWRLAEATGPAPWIEQRLLDEQRRRLPESSYRRLFLNEWSSGDDSLVSEEDLRACVTLGGPLEPESGQRYVIGVDVGLKHDRTVAAICHSNSARIVLDRIQTWQGTRMNPVPLDAVEAWLLEAVRRYSPARIVCDPWQSAQLMQRLRSTNVSITEHAFTESSISRITSSLFGLLRDHSIALPDDDDLLDELLNVRVVTKPSGLLRLDHSHDRHDDRAVAVALAAHQLLQRSRPRPLQSLSPNSLYPNGLDWSPWLRPNYQEVFR
jgi:phage terminase large subunit-like protein